MPIRTNEISLREMQWLIDEGYICAECGGRLNIATLNGELVLRCGNDINHSEITAHDRENEERIRRYRMDSNALMKMDERAMARRVEMAKFPQQLTPTDKHVLVVAARSYGFDPLMNEITIYQGRPYVTFEGRYRKAQETGLLNGVSTRPATREEREAWGIPDGDYFFRADVYKKGCDYAFIGWGRVFASEISGDPHLPVAKNPQRMAEKRAEVQALKKAFSIPLPSFEYIGTNEETDIVEVLPENAEATTESAKTQKEAPEPTDKPARPRHSPESLKTLLDAQKACYLDFGLQPKDFLAELNVKSLSEITISPAECYRKIAKVRM